MSALSLRARLVAGLIVVAVVLGVVSWVVTATTRSHLVDQIDDQLLAASDPDRDGRFGGPSSDLGSGFDRPPPSGEDRPPGEPPERFSSMFEGMLHPDEGLEVFFEPNLPGQDFSSPDLNWDTVAASPSTPFTTNAVDGDVRYRVLAVASGDGSFIRALPLADTDETVDQLILFQITGLGAVLAVLAAVAWWVIRLGIRPINAMTRAATDITDDDLSARVPEPPAAGTEAGALARALNTMLSRIETAVDDQRRTEGRLRRFVADASHELRTPVTTIQGYAELYRHGGLHDPEELDDAMRRTEQEAQRMGRLVEDMLTLAKLDQNRPHDCTNVDLTSLVTDTVAEARVTAPDHRIDATIDPDLTIVGDQDRLKQVLVNIIGNATIHTPANTIVRVDARQVGTEAVIEVHDNGPGIDPAHLSRVTERFYRADPSRARARGGSGLGLSIAEAAIDAHGGTLRITSQPDHGTTVTLGLPLPK